MVYELNRYGKIVVNEKEVYYGCIKEIDVELRAAKLFLIDWRDKEHYPHSFQQMTAPLNSFTIKYDDDAKGEN
ncbi:MAG: hypothetical protein WC325_11065 [Candidatus Bathyarchaeia archaeon]|jgi:hypothetical protein